VALGQLTLALGTLGGFLGRLLMLLRFAGVEVRFLAVAPRLFAQAFPFPFALGAALARGHRGEDEQNDDDNDYGDDQSS
jgi:hypothetical protein